MPVHVEDKRLVLPDGRTLAYANNGNTSSSTVVLFFHGIFSVGDASKPPQILLGKNYHLIAPSLPGWGSTDPASSPAAYAATVAADATALLAHLCLRPITALFLAGRDFGTVAAQILYAAPRACFPAAAAVRGLLLIAPLSPPHRHAAYARALPWTTYLLAGPPRRLVSMHLAQCVLAPRLATPAAAEALVRSTFFAGLSPAAVADLAHWRDATGTPPGALERSLAARAQRSVATSWAGFLSAPAVLHSGWGGFVRAARGTAPPVLIIGLTEDPIGSVAMAEWLAAHYANAQLKRIDGGHLAAILHAEEIWEAFLG